MQKSSVFWIVVSGVIWCVVGVALLLLGVKLVVFASLEADYHCFLLSKLSKSSEQSALLLVTLGVCLGFVKGRLVLKKTVERVVSRIVSFPEPIKLSQVYSLKYLGLIALMILLGMLLRWLHVPSDLRGTIDITIGSALLNGSLFYFRATQREKPSNS